MNYRQPYSQYGFTRSSPPYPGAMQSQRYQQPVGIPATQYSSTSSHQIPSTSYLSDDDVFPDANVDTETTLNLLDQEFLKFQNFSPIQIFQTLFAYFFIFGTSKVFKSAIKPFKRGFFCNDNSIRYGDVFFSKSVVLFLNLSFIFLGGDKNYHGFLPSKYSNFAMERVRNNFKKLHFLTDIWVPQWWNVADWSQKMAVNQQISLYISSKTSYYFPS